MQKVLSLQAARENETGFMRTRVGESEKVAKWVRTAGEIRNAEKDAFNKNRDQTLIKIQPIRVRI